MSGEDIKTRVCSKCGKELPMTDEYFNKRGDGYQYQCKECQRKELKEYYETHKEKRNQYSRDRYARAKYTPEYKEKAKQYSQNRKQNKQCMKNEFLAKWRKPCQKCGEQRLYLIQFHHIDPITKKFDVCANIVSYKKAKICEEEVKKCVCLCSNCHNEFHYFYGANPEDPVNALKEYLNN